MNTDGDGGNVFYRRSRRKRRRTERTFYPQMAQMDTDFRINTEIAEGKEIDGQDQFRFPEPRRMKRAFQAASAALRVGFTGPRAKQRMHSTNQ